MRFWNRIRFVAAFLLYPLRSPLERLGIRIDIAAISNAHYREAFRNVPATDKAMILPHCIIDDKCPARFSKNDGILCVQCNRCRCGAIQKLCRERGWQFYITPSANFTKRLVQRKGLKAAAGAICHLEVERGIRSTRISLRGVHLKRNRVIPQLLLTTRYDCLNNEIDWEALQGIILAGDAPSTTAAPEADPSPEKTS